MDLASAEAEIRHVFGDTLITEASIGAAPPDILVKLSGIDIQCSRYATMDDIGLKQCNHPGCHIRISVG